MMLKALPSEGRFYCGPSVIAAFTGAHPKERVRSYINIVRGRKQTTGVCNMFLGEVQKVLKMFGMTVSQQFVLHEKNRRTLKDFVKQNPDKSYVVMVSGHFIAVSKGWCLDNGSRIPRPVDFFDGNRKVVKSFIEIC